MGFNKYLATAFVLFVSALFIAGFYVSKKDTRLENQMPAPENADPKVNFDPIYLSEKVLLAVPFTSQAPLGNWQDVREQNGCEEASLLMAMAWVKDEELTPEYVQREIKNMSDYHLQAHGHFHDLSNADTLNLLNEYFNYFKARLVENVMADDIKKELAQNRIVIVPINGELIGNPYYQTPGPINHKIVVVGYDDSQQEFITHDPGTSQGENYRYSYKILEESLADYPTGLHEQFKERKTSMIVVEK
jgi:hypothetical protein